MQEHLLRVVLLDNPWLESAPLEEWLQSQLPEPYLQRALKLEPEGLAGLVVGPRQAGKSTLIWKTLRTSGKAPLFLNCEELSIREWLTSPAEFLSDLKDLSGNIQCIFLEEIQHLPEAGLFIKGLVDRKTGYQGSHHRHICF